MLQSFIGTIDTTGLRSLRDEECSESIATPEDPNVVKFWAILDTDQLPQIRRALLMGHRGAALNLVAQQAKSLGRLCHP